MFRLATMRSVTDRLTDIRQYHANSRSYCVAVRSAKTVANQIFTPFWPGLPSQPKQSYRRGVTCHEGRGAVKGSIWLVVDVRPVSKVLSSSWVSDW